MKAIPKSSLFSFYRDVLIISRKFLPAFVFCLISPVTLAQFTETDGVTLWSGFAPGNSNWSNVANWSGGLGAPRKSQSWSVVYQHFPVGPIDRSNVTSVVNQDWTLQWLAIKDDVSLTLNSSGGSRLTLWEGLEVRGPNGKGPGQGHNINVPLVFGSTSGGTIQNRQNNTPVIINGSILNNHLLRLDNSQNSRIQINGVISGAGRLEKIDIGRAILRGNNTYTGATIINEGTLELSNTGRLADATSVFINNDAIFQLRGQVTDAINSLNGNGNVFIDSGSNLIVGNSITDAVGDFTGRLDINGPNAQLIKRNSGTQIIRGQVNNIWTFDNHFIAEGGLLHFTDTARFINNPSFELRGSGNIQFDSQTLFRDVIVNSLNQFDSLNGYTMRTLSIGIDTDATYRQTTGNTTSEIVNMGDNDYYATYFQTGGQNTVNDTMILGVGEMGVGEYAISGGKLSVTERIEVGFDGEGMFNIDGTGSVEVSQLRVGGREVINSSGFGMFDLNNGELNTDETFIGKGGSGGFAQNGGVHKAFTLDIGSDNPTQGAGSGFYEMNGGLLEANRVQILQQGEFTFNDGEIRLIGAGATLATGGAFNFKGGTLSTPLVLGSLLNQGGTISPGNSPGVTRITGNFVQTVGDILIEIAGSTPSDIDFIDVTGNADIRGGKVIFSFIDDFLPNESFQFDFITADGNLTVADALAYEFIGLREGFQFQIDQIGTSLRFLALTDGSSPVPIPASFWLFATALLGLLTRERFFSKAKQA